VYAIAGCKRKRRSYDNTMIFDSEKLSDLFAPLDLGWKERTKRELVLMEELIPLLRKQAEGREISELTAYE
jgi:type I restriction enzyme, R subunit